MPDTINKCKLLKSNELMLFYDEISWFHRTHVDTEPESIDDFTHISREIGVLTQKYQGGFYKKVLLEVFNEIELSFAKYYSDAPRIEVDLCDVKGERSG